MKEIETLTCSMTGQQIVLFSVEVSDGLTRDSCRYSRA